MYLIQKKALFCFNIMKHETLTHFRKTFIIWNTILFDIIYVFTNLIWMCTLTTSVYKQNISLLGILILFASSYIKCHQEIFKSQHEKNWMQKSLFSWFLNEISQVVILIKIIVFSKFFSKSLILGTMKSSFVDNTCRLCRFPKKLSS